jgi:hypothetical protein
MPQRDHWASLTATGISNFGSVRQRLADVQRPTRKDASGTAAMTMHKLRRDIIVILSLKVLIVLMAALFVFGPRQRPLIDSNAVDRRILNNSYR